MKTLLDAALALPEAERALLVRRLLKSLPQEENELRDRDLLAEVRRRRAEVESGEAKTIPWSKLKLEE